MTNPKPSLSFRLMTTSLGCALAGALSEAAAALVALGVWAAPVLLAYVKSLRGELCCVDAEQGLRPFWGSPAGGDGEVSRGGTRADGERRPTPRTLPVGVRQLGWKRGRQRRPVSQKESGMKWIGQKSGCDNEIM